MSNNNIIKVDSGPFPEEPQKNKKRPPDRIKKNKLVDEMQGGFLTRLGDALLMRPTSPVYKPKPAPVRPAPFARPRKPQSAIETHKPVPLVDQVDPDDPVILAIPLFPRAPVLEIPDLTLFDLEDLEDLEDSEDSFAYFCELLERIFSNQSGDLQIYDNGESVCVAFPLIKPIAFTLKTDRGTYMTHLLEKARHNLGVDASSLPYIVKWTIMSCLKRTIIASSLPKNAEPQNIFFDSDGYVKIVFTGRTTL